MTMLIVQLTTGNIYHCMDIVRYCYSKLCGRDVVQSIIMRLYML